MSAVRAALRISRRDAWRSKGRSALVLTMIGLPVLVITALATLIATFDVTPVEGLSRDLGTADARIRVAPGPPGVAEQDYTGSRAGTVGPLPRGAKPWTAEEVAGLLPPGSRVVPIISGSRVYRGRWFEPTPVVELDLRDPLTRGMYLLRQGRFPASAEEVVVSPWLVRHGVGIGSAISLSGSSISHRVVGVVDDAHQFGRDLVVAMPDSTRGPTKEWLVDTPAAVVWKDVRRLNAQGLVVQSRAVISAPNPPRAALDNMTSRVETSQLVVPGLVVMMIVLEVVLLAGPAFAVGIRRRRRELALIAAQGASARQLRSIVLADGVVLGGAATALGVAAGLAVVLAAIPIVESVNRWAAGPYEVPLGQVAGVAALGLASAVIAAVVPARQAARTDVVGALAGLRGEVRTHRGWPLAGLALLVVGFAGTLLAAQRGDLRFFGLGTVGIVGGSFCAMVGLVLLTPWLVGVVGRLAARLPLPFRLAARDSARNRARTAPALAAVAAATASLVAFMIGAANEDARRAGLYRPDEVYGAFSVDMVAPTQDQALRLRAAVERELPGVPLIDVYRPTYAGDDSIRLDSLPCDPEPYCRATRPIRVGGPDLLRYLAGRDDPAVAAALAAGKAVVFHPGVVRDGKATLRRMSFVDEPARLDFQVPAVEMRPVRAGLADALLPMSLATRFGLKPELRQFVVDPARHGVTPAEEDRITRMLADWGPNVSGRVERGYQSPLNLVLLLMGAAAVILVLGSTFAATGLAAADARPDVATLGAIGAPPGIRRLVTMGQAWFIAATGVPLGVLVGFVPGLAAVLSARNFLRSPQLYATDTTLVIPWPAIAALVVVLPLVAGLVAGVFARTRVTLTRRVT